MIIRDASSKRSRALSISIPKCSYSTRERPRPRPSTARPFERWSRNAIFSTTRSGSFHGTITAPVPSLMRDVFAAMYDRNWTLSGHAE